MSDQENQELPDEEAENLENEAPENDVLKSAESVEHTEDSEGTENGVETEPIDVETELEQAQLEIAKLKDAFLRAKAEEDNVRRRAEKDVANGRKFAVEGFAKEMVNVFDSLKLAVAVEVPENADDAVKAIHEGVDITLKQLKSGFAKFSRL